MEITNSETIKWRTDIFPASTKKALDFLASQKWLGRSRWYLGGGTALALYEGHRISADLDFFIPQKSFELPNLLPKFSKSDAWTVDIAKENTIYGRLFNTKVSFIAYPFFIAKEKQHWYGFIRILHPRDITVMKIIAISQRGKKRDFVDLYWYTTRRERLADILRRLPLQYPTVAHNYHHIMKSLTYFEDAEQDPMPKLFFRATWKDIKRYFQREVAKITKEFLGLK